jgi:hypothetical protein
LDEAVHAEAIIHGLEGEEQMDEAFSRHVSDLERF